MSGSLVLDKIEYLRRDARFCGVPYGEVDVSRLLQGLTVLQDPESGAGLLDLVPDLWLDEATAALFGGNRLFEYSFEFVETDRKLIAVEYADFGLAIGGVGGHPEVDGAQGARSVAIAYAWRESQVAGRAVTVDEVLNDQVNDYQADINDSLGL